MNTTRGYGIAGHIGSYNSKVRHGNWVEDSLSYERIQNPPPVYKNYTTEFRANFNQQYEVNPAEKTKQARQTADLKAKNKDGMSYTTLFEHGNYRNKEEGKYITNTMRSMEETQKKFGTRTNALQSSKWREIRREMADITIRRPESRDASVYFNKYS